MQPFFCPLRVIALEEFRAHPCSLTFVNPDGTPAEAPYIKK